MFRRLLPLGLAGILLACGGGDADRPSASAATSSPSVSVEAAATDTDGATDTGSGVVPDAPAALQFSAPLVGGGDIELTTLAGRPVLLWFWAPW